jgi:hypothetical protein
MVQVLIVVRQVCNVKLSSGSSKGRIREYQCMALVLAVKASEESTRIWLLHLLMLDTGI